MGSQKTGVLVLKIAPSRLVEREAKEKAAHVGGALQKELLPFASEYVVFPLWF